MKREIPQEYVDKAKALSRDEAEQIFSRMRRKMKRRIEDINPLEAVALQLQKEDEDLIEWRSRWAEVKARENKQ